MKTLSDESSQVKSPTVSTRTLITKRSYGNVGLKETIDPSRNPAAIARILSTVYVSLSTSFPNMQFECCKLLQGTLGGHFDIFAASGESIAWDFLWKTRSSPSVVRVCLVSQFNFFSSAFDPRAWTKDVFWKEILDVSTSLLHLRTKGEQAVAVDWHVRMDVDMLAHVIWIFRIFWSDLFFQLMVVKNQQSENPHLISHHLILE